MITGVGLDIIEVERVAEKISRESGFRELVFSTAEIAYCETKTNKFEHYAARFAAKEAFFKALGTGWKNGTSFNEVEITNNDHGKPSLKLLGSTAITLHEFDSSAIQLSISHLKNIACAIVIIEES